MILDLTQGEKTAVSNFFFLSEMQKHLRTNIPQTQ